MPSTLHGWSRSPPDAPDPPRLPWAACAAVIVLAGVAFWAGFAWAVVVIIRLVGS